MSFVIFCRYGYCLEEETAKEYLKFLVNGIKNITNRHKTISAFTTNLFNIINTFLIGCARGESGLPS